MARVIPVPDHLIETGSGAYEDIRSFPHPFGRHLLLERVNGGGMAEVFRAKSVGLGGFERFVALKRILPAYAANPEFISMFIDEAKIAAQLSHQNIVQLYELDRHGLSHFITMEYVAGRDLRQCLDYQQSLGTLLDPLMACYIVAQVGEALDHAHRKKDAAGRPLDIIHRDVTPQNIILSFDGEVKLCDFGIAKAAVRAKETEVGVLKGKFSYLAPEQVRNRQVDRRADIFSLGTVFYETLTGTHPFLRDSDLATLEAVSIARAPRPRDLEPSLPAHLEAVVLRMLAVDPDDRYAWPSEVVEDLKVVLAHGRRAYSRQHLRAWMAETYAAAIHEENAKVQFFMQAAHPDYRAMPTEPDPTVPTPVSPALAEPFDEDTEHCIGLGDDEAPTRTPAGSELPITTNHREPLVVTPVPAEPDGDDPFSDSETILTDDETGPESSALHAELRSAVDAALQAVEPLTRDREQFSDNAPTWQPARPDATTRVERNLRPKVIDLASMIPEADPASAPTDSVEGSSPLEADFAEEPDASAPPALPAEKPKRSPSVFVRVAVIAFAVALIVVSATVVVVVFNPPEAPIPTRLVVPPTDPSSVDDVPLSTSEQLAE